MIKLERVDFSGGAGQCGVERPRSQRFKDSTYPHDFIHSGDI
jgi:hypothetical protein